MPRLRASENALPQANALQPRTSVTVSTVIEDFSPAQTRRLGYPAVTGPAVLHFFGHCFIHPCCSHRSS